MGDITFRFNKHHLNQLLKLLIAFELLLVSLYIMDDYFHLFRHHHVILDLDAEQTIGSWCSSCQLLLIGVFLLINNFRAHSPNPTSCKFLTLIGFGFIFLSADESASIHEAISLSLQHVAWMPRFKGQHGLWISVYAALGLGLLWLTRKNLFEIWLSYKKECTIFICGFLTLLFGAVVLEIISYQYLRTPEMSDWYTLEVAFEEGFEMLGASITLYAVLLFTLNSNNS